MRHFDTDNRVGIGEGEIGCGLGVHVLNVLFFGIARHTDTADIKKDQHARASAIDDRSFEIGEVPPA